MPFFCHSLFRLTMASVVSEEVIERLTCAVCMEQFKEPKVLPCLHTYCKATHYPILPYPKTKQNKI